MASSSIDSFKASVQADFARPNLFSVGLQFPGALKLGDGNAALQLTALGEFTVRAANLPSSQMGVIEVPYRGRVLKIAGDRTFEPWTITIMNDTKFSMRSAFESWFSSIQAYNENFSSIGTLGDVSDTTGYFADMTVSQLSRDLTTGGTSASSAAGDKTPTTLRKYNFINVFPSNISAIDLDFGSNDAIEEFTVELQVQYWSPAPPAAVN
jgi:hypothetical protein